MLQIFNSLGAKYGYSVPDSNEQKDTFLAKKAGFEKRFAEECKSLACKDILGYDLSKPEGKDIGGVPYVLSDFQ